MWGRECMRNVNKESSCFDSSSGLGVGDWNVYPNGEASSMGDSCRFVFFIRIQNVNAILNILGARSIDCLTCNRLLTELSKHSNAAAHRLSYPSNRSHSRSAPSELNPY